MTLSENPDKLSLAISKRHEHLPSGTPILLYPLQWADENQSRHGRKRDVGLRRAYSRGMAGFQ